MNKGQFKPKVTPDQVQEMLKLRKKGLSFRAIGEKIGCSYETARVHIDKNTPLHKKIKIVSKTKKKKPLPRHRLTRDYDFLQYIRPVFRWATENYGLSRPYVELILFLYPKGVFTQNDFYNFHKILGIYQIKTFKMMLKEGFIVVWRPKKRGQKALYSLTNKAKQMCNKMHKFLTGEKEIPINSKNNILAQEGRPRIDKYYIDVIKSMNKDKS